MNFALLSIIACNPIMAVPDGLPEHVYLKTSTESFNSDWYFVINDGLIWVKPNEWSGERDPADWTLLGKTGVPDGRKLDNWGEPGEIIEISADGCHLHALSSDGHLYRGTDMRHNVVNNVNWTDAWGWPYASGDGLSLEIGLKWAVSDSHPFDVDHYEDIFNYEHSVGAGVAHIYRISKDYIEFNDWWLPNDWSRKICVPNTPQNISVSASTIFIIDEYGDLWTRLYDFDTAGENNLLTYSYLEEDVSRSVRGLPAESWKKQPPPEGFYTDLITIFQNGEGNSARTLRVEGMVDGKVGYYEKPIFSDVWEFFETNNNLKGNEIHSDGLGDGKRGEYLDLTLSKQDSSSHFKAHMIDWDLFCSPATLLLRYQGDIITSNNTPLEFTFFHVHSMVDYFRSTNYWEEGTKSEIRGALLIPNTDGIDNKEAKTALEDFFEGREVINFVGEALIDQLELVEIEKGDWFQVPRSQKGKKNSLYALK